MQCNHQRTETSRPLSHFLVLRFHSIGTHFQGIEFGNSIVAIVASYQFCLGGMARGSRMFLFTQEDPPQVVTLASRRFFMLFTVEYARPLW